MESLDDADDMIDSAAATLIMILLGTQVRHEDGEVCFECWEQLVQEVIEHVRSNLLDDDSESESRGDVDSDCSPTIH